MSFVKLLTMAFFQCMVDRLPVATHQNVDSYQFSHSYAKEVISNPGDSQLATCIKLELISSSGSSTHMSVCVGTLKYAKIW